MAVFEITYFDVKDSQEHKTELEYDGPEVSIADTWLIGMEKAIGYCNEKNVCLISITNICFKGKREKMKYTVAKCTAIALCDRGDEDYRQGALMVESNLNGELAEYIVFGYEMPGNAEEFARMCEDTSAWEPIEEQHKMKFILAPVTASFWASKGVRQ